MAFAAGGVAVHQDLGRWRGLGVQPSNTRLGGWEARGARETRTVPSGSEEQRTALTGTKGRTKGLL